MAATLSHIGVGPSTITAIGGAVPASISMVNGIMTGNGIIISNCVGSSVSITNTAIVMNPVDGIIGNTTTTSTIAFEITPTCSFGQLSFQWQTSTDLGVTFTNVVPTTTGSPVFRILSDIASSRMFGSRFPQANNGNLFRCVVSSGTTVVVSAAVQIQVGGIAPNPPAPTPP